MGGVVADQEILFLIVLLLLALTLSDKDSVTLSESVTLMTIPDKLRNSNHDIEGL